MNGPSTCTPSEPGALRAWPRRRARLREFSGASVMRSAQRRRAEAAMRGDDGADRLRRRRFVEQMTAAAVDLPIDETRRQHAAAEIDGSRRRRARRRRDNRAICSRPRHQQRNRRRNMLSPSNRRAPKAIPSSRRQRVSVILRKLRGRSGSRPSARAAASTSRRSDGSSRSASAADGRRLADRASVSGPSCRRLDDDHFRAPRRPTVERRVECPPPRRPRPEGEHRESPARRSPAGPCITSADENASAWMAQVSFSFSAASAAIAKVAPRPSTKADFELGDRVRQGARRRGATRRAAPAISQGAGLIRSSPRHSATSAAPAQSAAIIDLVAATECFSAG